ncbi:MAG TPA: hypothetical protein VHV74_08690 [Pseudonocardiaceae bacterium]|nr:hypothetical protein [Pseudonocardiaceae bacterium]
MGGGRVTVPWPEDLFAILVDEFAAGPDVTPPGEPGARGFGAA